MDFQTLIVHNYAAGAEVLLDRMAKLIAVARTAGMRVIYAKPCARYLFQPNQATDRLSRPMSPKTGQYPLGAL
jgi:hypothetical protein